MKWLILLIISIFLFGCGPKQFEPYKPKEIHIEKEEYHNLDLSTIKKPNKIVPIYVNDQFEEVDVNNATMILLEPSEYAKVSALLKLAIGYKKIAIEESELVNIKVDKINSMIELLELEKHKADMYRQYWVDAENKYREELYEHKKDNVINKTTNFIIMIGSAVVFGTLL